MGRTAFSRACEHLAYARWARWCAAAGAILTGLLSALFLTILLLFVDLLITQGAVPNFADLSAAEQSEFRESWQRLPVQDRRSAIDALALPIDEEERTRLIDRNESARQRSINDSVRWQAWIGWLLEERVSGDAAHNFRKLASTHHEMIPGERSERVHLGVLGRVVRARQHFSSRILGWLASWNSWMWKPAASGIASWPYLLGLSLLAVVMALMRFLSLGLMLHGSTMAALEVCTRLRRQLYYHRYRIGAVGTNATGTDETAEVFAHHVDAVRDGLVARLTVAVRAPLEFVLFAGLALTVHFWLASACLFAALVVWQLSLPISNRLREQALGAARKSAAQFGLLQESMRMIQLAKCYLMDQFNQKRVERQLHEYAGSEVCRIRGEALSRPILVVLASTAAVIVLFVAGGVVLSGGLDLTNLVVLLAALSGAYVSLTSWSDQRQIMQRASASAVVIFDFLDRRGAVAQAADAEFLPVMNQAIEFDQISLRDVATGRMILANVHFRIDARHRVAIVGTDQNSKNAVLDLVARMVDPTAGELRIDGKNLRWVTLDSLRNQVAIVKQEQLIFGDTVANNIGGGDPSYSVPQIIEAAKAVHAHHFIEKLRYGYETTIGETGHSLRVGEQFRIALARAVLRDPAVLLIEEPATPLDKGTEAVLEDAYKRMIADRTVIFLPRRLATIEMCDRILLLHDGRLDADGTHEQLLRSNERYRHLLFVEYNMMTGAAE